MGGGPSVMSLTVFLKVFNVSRAGCQKWTGNWNVRRTYLWQQLLQAAAVPLGLWAFCTTTITWCEWRTRQRVIPPHLKCTLRLAIIDAKLILRYKDNACYYLRNWTGTQLQIQGSGTRKTGNICRISWSQSQRVGTELTFCSSYSSVI